MQVTNIANNPKCPTCNSRMACFPDKSWRCPKCAPQAQEETRGAPAPEPQSPRKGWTWIPGHWLRWWESGSATVWPNGTWHTFDSDGGGGENASDPTIGEAMDEAEKAIKRQGFDRATEDEEESQPPASASPGGRECWVMFLHGEIAACSATKQDHWVRMVEAPAAPEAGAPGTQEGGSQP